MTLPDFTDSLTAGLAILILAGMIKNAVDVRALNVKVDNLCKRVDKLANWAWERRNG